MSSCGAIVNFFGTLSNFQKPLQFNYTAINMLIVISPEQTKKGGILLILFFVGFLFIFLKIYIVTTLWNFPQWGSFNEGSQHVFL